MPTEAEVRAMTAQIVAAYLTNNPVNTRLDLNDLQASVYETLACRAGA